MKLAPLRVSRSASILSLALLCSCTPAQTAQVQQGDTSAIDLTNAVCSLAPDAPAQDQGTVDLVCTLAGVGEQLVNVVVGAIGAFEGDSGTTAAVTTSTLIRVPVKQIRITVPTAKANAILAVQSRRAKK